MLNLTVNSQFFYSSFVYNINGVESEAVGLNMKLESALVYSKDKVQLFPICHLGQQFPFRGSIVAAKVT